MKGVFHQKRKSHSCTEYSNLETASLRRCLPKELGSSSYTNLQALGWWLHQPHTKALFLVVSVLINNVHFQDSDFPLLIQTSAVHSTGARLDPEVGEGWKEIFFSLLTFFFSLWQMVLSFPCDLYGLLLGWLYFSRLHCKLYQPLYDRFGHWAINFSRFLKELLWLTTPASNLFLGPGYCNSHQNIEHREFIRTFLRIFQQIFPFQRLLFLTCGSSNVACRGGHVESEGNTHIRNENCIKSEDNYNVQLFPFLVGKEEELWHT